MKLLYVTKAMPFGAAEAFIFPEIEAHMAHGWSVWIAPVSRPPLRHKRGEALLPHTLAVPLITPAMLGVVLSEMLRQPGPVLGSLLGLLRSRPKLWPRNLAVWPKAVWLARQARQLGIDHIHVHWIAVPATMAMIASRLTGISLSITCHRYDIAQQNLIPEKFAAASFVRAIDGPGAQELIDQISVNEKRPVIIRMGVTLPDVDIANSPEPMSRMRAIIGARLVEKKGHATFIRAVARAKEAGVLVEVDAFGDGPLEAELRKLAKGLGVQDLFHFRGNASHEELLAKLVSKDYNIAILPSVTTASGDKEGIPVFLMEAMAAGVPVISTPNGGICELISADSGILVPEYDDQALAEAMVTLARDGERRLSNAHAARIRVREQFSAERCFTRLRDLIEQVIQPHKG